MPTTSNSQYNLWALVAVVFVCAVLLGWFRLFTAQAAYQDVTELQALSGLVLVGELVSLGLFWLTHTDQPETVRSFAILILVISSAVAVILVGRW